MGNRLYVGNLSFSTSEADLRQEFSKCGSVTEAKIVMDRETGRSRGFGFVQYSTEGEANTAIQALNGTPFAGRPLTVKVAEDRRANGGGGGQRSFGGGAPRPSNGGYNPGGGFSSGGPSESSGGGRNGGGKGRGGGKGSRRRREDNDWG